MAFLGCRTVVLDEVGMKNGLKTAMSGKDFSSSLLKEKRALGKMEGRNGRHLYHVACVNLL